MRITETQKERRVESQHRLQGSIFAGVLMLLLFWGLRSCQMWEAPDPPPPRAGMVMDFGKLVPGGQPDGSPSTPQPATPPTPATPPEPEPEAVTSDNELPPLEESLEPAEEPSPEPLPEPEEEPTTTPPEENKPEPEKNDTPAEEEPPKGEPAEEDGDSGQEDIEQEADKFEGDAAGEGGTSLQLAGWHWDHPPVVTDNSREIGTMEFEIIINKYGEVMSVELKQRYSISIALVNTYKDAIERMTFSPKGSGQRPNYTTGTIRIELTRQ